MIDRADGPILPPRPLFPSPFGLRKDDALSRTRTILLVKMLETEPDFENEDHFEGDDDPTRDSMLNAVALGSWREVVRQLSAFNTAPDGSSDTPGMLFGPGIIVQLPMLGPDDPVMQVVVTIEEEGIAWPVLTRVCRLLKWKMMDPKTGRTFG